MEMFEIFPFYILFRVDKYIQISLWWTLSV